MGRTASGRNRLPGDPGAAAAGGGYVLVVFLAILCAWPAPSCRAVTAREELERGAELYRRQDYDGAAGAFAGAVELARPGKNRALALYDLGTVRAFQAGAAEKRGDLAAARGLYGQAKQALAGAVAEDGSLDDAARNLEVVKKALSRLRRVRQAKEDKSVSGNGRKRRPGEKGKEDGEDGERAKGRRHSGRPDENGGPRAPARSRSGPDAGRDRRPARRRVGHRDRGLGPD